MWMSCVSFISVDVLRGIGKAPVCGHSPARMQSAATVILTGASGFIGQHLMRSLGECQVSLRTLNIRQLEENAGGEFCVRAPDGSLSKLSSLRHCTLVHLA